MKLTCPLIVVKNMARAKEFYERLLNQHVVMDFGDNITFDGGFSLQTEDSWLDIIDMSHGDVRFGGNDSELYFETEDLDRFLLNLNAMPNILLVHDVKEHPWGQRVVRFYDPDDHIIEVGESMCHVVKRLISSGMNVEQTAAKTQHPPEFIYRCLSEGMQNKSNI